MAAWPPPKAVPVLELRKEIDKAIKEAFAETTLTLTVGPIRWWNLRIRFAVFLVGMAAWILGSKMEVDQETPRSKHGDLG